MASQITKGIKLLQDIPGEGAEAAKGSTITYNARLFLSRGEEVTPDSRSVALYGSRLDTRIVDGVQLIDHRTLLGKRCAIAGVEKSLHGMRAGGYREVQVSPHLAYGEAGVKDLIPPNAMLRIQLWVQDVQDVTWPPSAQPGEGETWKP